MGFLTDSGDLLTEAAIAGGLSLLWSKFGDSEKADFMSPLSTTRAMIQAGSTFGGALIAGHFFPSVTHMKTNSFMGSLEGVALKPLLAGALYTGIGVSMRAEPAMDIPTFAKGAAINVGSTYLQRPIRNLFHGHGFF